MIIAKHRQAVLRALLKLSRPRTSAIVSSMEVGRRWSC